MIFRSAESYGAYIESMPWLSVPFQQASVRAELAQLYGIRGIPTLLLLDSNGHVITMDGRSEIVEDPLAQVNTLVKGALAVNFSFVYTEFPLEA